MPGARDKGGPRSRYDKPLSDAELTRIGEATLSGYRSLVVAVSGGPDSMAAMLLVEHWRRTAVSPPRVIVATVDHGLRAGSAGEAQWVGEQARRLGLDHTILRWDGPKPETGRQAAARAARYRLLEGLAGGLPAPAAVVLAHHLDDQAETVLMRLARGSGVDGLAGMQAVRTLGVNGTVAVRPFLDIEKTRLVATLVARGIEWCEDPSNADIAFERVRIRRAMAEASGLGLSARPIAESARRLARARVALEQLTGELIGRVVDTHGGAYASLPAEAYDAAPAELQLRLIQRLAHRFGGGGEPARTPRQEALAERLARGGAVTSTLGGCQFRRTRDEIIAIREPGRRGLPKLALAPGQVAVWDGRFRVTAGPGVEDGISVAAATAEGLAELLEAGEMAQRKVLKAGGLMRRGHLMMPAFWQRGHLIACPALGLHVAGLGAEFITP